MTGRIKKAVLLFVIIALTACNQVPRYSVETMVYGGTVSKEEYLLHQICTSRLYVRDSISEGGLGEAWFSVNSFYLDYIQVGQEACTYMSPDGDFSEGMQTAIWHSGVGDRFKLGGFCFVDGEGTKHRLGREYDLRFLIE